MVFSALAWKFALSRGDQEKPASESFSPARPRLVVSQEAGLASQLPNIRPVSRCTVPCPGRTQAERIVSLRQLAPQAIRPTAPSD